MNERIVIDPRICHGKPVIRGTRIPVAPVVGSLAGGMKFEEVQRDYDLTINDNRAALKFRRGISRAGTAPSLAWLRMRFLIDNGANPTVASGTNA